MTTRTDLRSHAAALRRRVHVLAAAAVLGLAAGVVYVIEEPPLLTSTTLVLLPTPATAESSNSDVETQVRIALSANILEQAGKAANPALGLRELEKIVEVSAPTNQLVQIDARSIEAEEAQVIAGRCRRLRQLRSRYRSRGNLRRPCGPHQAEGRPAGADRSTAEGNRNDYETPAVDRPEFPGG